MTTVAAGSVANASRTLYSAQPSISKAVKDTEESFGGQLPILSLFKRGPLNQAGTTVCRVLPGIARLALGLRACEKTLAYCDRLQTRAAALR